MSLLTAGPLVRSTVNYVYATLRYHGFRADQEQHNGVPQKKLFLLCVLADRIAISRSLSLGGSRAVRRCAPSRAPPLRSLIPQLVRGLDMLLQPW